MASTASRGHLRYINVYTHTHRHACSLALPTSPMLCAVSMATTSEKRALPHSLPSSRRRRSPSSSAPPPYRVFAFVSAPIDTKANTFAFPSVSESEHVPFRTHVPCFGPQKPFRSRSQTHTHTHTRTPFPISPHPRNAALHRPPRGPRPRPPVGRVGRACSRAHLTTL